jgi:hypothetical protein
MALHFAGDCRNGARRERMGRDFFLGDLPRRPGEPVIRFVSRLGGDDGPDCSSWN